MTSGRAAMGQGAVDGLQGGDAHRAAGSVHEGDLVGQHLVDAVTQDRVGLAAADLHDHPGAGDGRLDPLQQDRGPGRDREIR